jgi:FMN hydrolase / 5-amino-6-(5-phospho-D-ribitylamino)uracil phosphatase
MPPRIRAVSFDLFDTLVDLALEELVPVRVEGELVTPTAPALHAVVSEVAPVSFGDFVRELGSVDREMRRRQYREGREVSTRERFGALARALGLPGGELVERLRRVHMAGLRGQVRVLEHHPALLQGLGRSLPLAVCSNFTDTETALEVLEQASLREPFGTVTISEAVGFRKPRREIFEALLAGLGVAPEEVLHVGDNLEADVGGASRLGMRTAWLTRRVRDPSDARRRHLGPLPDHTLADLAELPALLERIG